MPHNILIVDDSAVTRAMIKRTIKLSDLPVENFFEAGHGQAALEVLASQAVDLVLADLNMPVMDGVEMTQRMRHNQATRDIPVIIVSAEPNLHLLEELLQQGVQGFVRKPFTPENVRHVISQTLGETHA